jgi:biotin carboxyl carrier protein
METNQKLKVLVNGKPYLIEVGDLAISPLEVKVNGRSYQVGIEVIDEAPGPSDAHPSSESRQPAEDKFSRATTSIINAVTAPMPGNIVNIAVKSGDLVSRDQVLCKLEAMKMQNAIRSPRDGIIASVAVTSGQAVGYGDILFTFG